MVLKCNSHNVTLNTDTNKAERGMSMPDRGGSCALYNVQAVDLKKLAKVGDELTVNQCHITRLS